MRVPDTIGTTFLRKCRRLPTTQCMTTMGIEAWVAGVPQQPYRVLPVPPACGLRALGERP